MAKVIAQRVLGNANAKVIEAVVAGESFRHHSQRRARGRTSSDPADASNLCTSDAFAGLSDLVDAIAI